MYATELVTLCCSNDMIFIRLVTVSIPNYAEHPIGQSSCQYDSLFLPSMQMSYPVHGSIGWEAVNPGFSGTILVEYRVSDATQ